MAIGAPPDDNDKPGCSKDAPGWPGYQGSYLMRAMSDHADQMNEFVQGQMTQQNIQGEFSAEVINVNDPHGNRPVIVVTINGLSVWNYHRLTLLYYGFVFSHLIEEWVKCRSSENNRVLSILLIPYSL